MSYHKPENVTSPKDRWKLGTVLYPGKENGLAAAEGKWDNESVLGIRRNGNDEKKIGSPHSFGNPTWFIVPKEIESAIRTEICRLRQEIPETGGK